MDFTEVIMKRFLMMDRSGKDRMTAEFLTVSEAESEFFNHYGYEPDIIKIIDDMGGVLEVIKE